MQKHIVVHSLNKIFHARKLHAVKDVSFDLEQGQCLGIVGESGSGKSTVAKMILGTLEPSSGEILINGTNFWKLSPKERRAFHRKVQMVYQDPLSSFSPRMTIGDYLCEPRINYDNISKKEAEKEAKAYLDKVELPETFMKRFPHQLSGGQLQRVAIARALIIKPEILICDEATSALDVSIQNQVLELLHDLRKERSLTMLFICHDLAVVKDISDKIIVMYDGNVVEQIASNDLANSATHPYTKQLINSVFDVYCDQNMVIEYVEKV